ncbi:hypothetical protein Ait01nite_023820 [Actinoplanes italicus]|uniref:Uncharacterized protein n=2 Tax=Actinoplanes italicus TaxID=113567 RepID=A0A2T0KFW3_9ACTN|nr:hypothetical protein CLV67_105420 [Actinoplanes italicus]GIE29337.1 hypothetical protein Ait01nite_023820 [Actinoplanes italicus]
MLGAWLAYWWLAYPRHEVCAMKLPAPAGCSSLARTPVATFWTVVTGTLYAATLLLAAWRPGRRWWFAPLFGLFLSAVCGYFAVLHA